MVLQWYQQFCESWFQKNSRAALAVSQTNVHVIKSKPSKSVSGGGKVNILLVTCKTGKCAFNVMKNAKSEKERVGGGRERKDTVCYC